MTSQPEPDDRLELAVRELVDALRAAMTTEAWQAPPPDRLLDIATAASRCGISRSKFYTELRAGNVRTVRVGRRRLVPESAVSEFIAEHSS